MIKNLNEITIPDSKMVQDAQDIVHDYGNELIWNHSNRVYLFGAIKGLQDDVPFDYELLYVSALFHDLGLTPTYSSPNKRFEVDGANAAREFLSAYNLNNEKTQLVWDSIALHTTIGVAEYKESNVALLYHGVGMDVMGDNFDQFSEDVRKVITTKFPRKNFKRNILEAFYEGLRHKPETTFGNIKADVISHFDPHYQHANFCSCVLHSKWES
ncbi:HD domain-containing protein [Salibacterium aidingense]|uniref:HD domain-containing protein n=1 Tax=Salibacterium aidingense TaxID=384933 RepID=UPI0003F8F71F|nr:HD domain-containing protein [Salibacterium aidingense]